MSADLEIASVHPYGPRVVLTLVGPVLHVYDRGGDAQAVLTPRDRGTLARAIAAPRFAVLEDRCEDVDFEEASGGVGILVTPDSWVRLWLVTDDGTGEAAIYVKAVEEAQGRGRRRGVLAVHPSIRAVEVMLRPVDAARLVAALDPTGQGAADAR